MTAANIRVLLCHDHEVLRSGLASLLGAADGFEVVATAAARLITAGRRRPTP